MKPVKSFEPMTTISTFQAQVFLLSRKNRDRLCDGCFRESELLPCSCCSVFKFCSDFCQKNSSHLHKHECVILQGNSSKMKEISDEALFLLRLYKYFQSDEGKDVNEEIFGKRRKFADLMSNRENIIKDEKRCGHFMKLSAEIKLFIEDLASLPDPKELLVTFGKMVTNSFSILDDDLNAIGAGLFLGASILDHSCDPNCVAIFSGTKLILRSNRNINKNDELTISYIEEIDTTKRRQEELLENYYFLCSCRHCKDIDRDVQMIGLKTNEKEFQGDIHKKCIQMEKEAQTLKENGDAQGMYELSKRFFSTWSEKLQPQSIYIYKCLDIYFDACIELSMWDKIPSMGSKMIKIHSTYITHSHPKQVLDYLKYAKVLLFLRSYKKAYEYLKKAEKEIILFGEHSQLGQTLTELKCQCLMEGRL